MLRYKGVEFTRLDLPNMTHKAILPLLRYRGSTVPVMTIDGKRVSRDDEDRPRAGGAACPSRRCSRRRTARRSRAPRRGPTPRSRTACASSPATPSARTRRRWRRSSPGRCSASRRTLVKRAVPLLRPGRVAADAHLRRHRRGLPGGAARPARPRRRAARRGRDRRRAPERRRLPDRPVRAADAELRPAARAHRRPPRRRARPRARPRLSRAGSGKYSRTSWLPF